MAMHNLALLTPEARELEKKRTELTALEFELTERELDLATFKAEVDAFTAVYLRRFGPLFAELDETEAQIAELQALRAPSAEARERSNEARAKARQTAEAVSGQAQEPERLHFQPTPDLKDLYRTVAKRLHPDLAGSEKERERRHRVMARANEAYQTGDVEKLQAILAEWESSPDSVEGDGVAPDLVRTLRKLDAVKRRLAGIELETELLTGSDFAVLFLRAREAESVGRDLLREMEDDVQAITASRRRELAKLNGA
jgi:hypothetical protein